ncbi:hypothetical protein M378DRAFT_13143 [Amanita muscaria Koide BX008]|uniref:Uncharacterized protein n=1 Tax=Amanita muscaria (strain Koide BX008) TaxID=946122 RepID=A0A0C2WK40_AMAMK|nr:hypothetical protein M378DRAFT_13143 [Amanita muscaria Koide BX008]
MSPVLPAQSVNPQAWTILALIVTPVIPALQTSAPSSPPPQQFILPHTPSSHITESPAVSTTGYPSSLIVISDPYALTASPGGEIVEEAEKDEAPNRIPQFDA